MDLHMVLYRIFLITITNILEYQMHLKDKKREKKNKKVTKDKTAKKNV